MQSCSRKKKGWIQQHQWTRCKECFWVWAWQDTNTLKRTQKSFSTSSHRSQNNYLCWQESAHRQESTRTNTHTRINAASGPIKGCATLPRQPCGNWNESMTQAFTDSKTMSQHVYVWPADDDICWLLCCYFICCGITEESPSRCFMGKTQHGLKGPTFYSKFTLGMFF